MRLFTALWPPADAVAALAAATAPAEDPAAPPGWRAVDPATWHVTLAFHGEADPGVLARSLDRAARGTTAPRLRIAGAGTFPGVRWAGLETCSEPVLRELVERVGGDAGTFVPHVTVLRARRRPGPDAEAEPPTPWSGHRGPWWTPDAVLLVASEPVRGGSRYRVVHRVPLASPG